MQKVVRNSEREWPRWLTNEQLELLVLALAAPPLLFPGRFPVAASLVALGLLVIPFFLRYWRTGEFIRYCHVNLPVLSLLLFFLPLSFFVSPLPMTVSWPRLTALSWSIGLFFVLANWPDDTIGRARGRTVLTLPTQLYLVLGVVVAVVGLLGMRSVDKLFYIALPDSLVGWSLFGDGLATNEIAGALTLFVPFAIALALGALQTHRKRLALVAIPLATLFLAVMILTQSRTALTGTVVAVALVLVLLLRPSWKWFAVGLVLAGIAVIAADRTGLLDRFVFAGANSWESVIGPRLDVWGQARFALRDSALWGTGLGMFGLVSTRLYPFAPVAQAKILEDAHNLYLQSMLDFGLVGGLIFAMVLIYALVVVARMVRRRRSGTMGRAWATGLLAALVAHMLYSITDAVALGTLAGIPLWFLLGMVMAHTHDAKPKLHPAVVAIVALSGFVLIGGLARIAYPTNQATRIAAIALLQGANQAEAAQAVAAAAESQCDLRWHEGLLYEAQNRPAARDAAWASLLGCTDRFTHFMPILVPDDAALAQEVMDRQPGSSVGYFWRAEIVTPADPALAVSLYRRGLELAPTDGRRWAYLADLLVETDPDAALAAYLQSCHHGDPGANGCLRAGALAEKQGKLQDAIAYYRLSKYGPSRDRADRLESELAAQK